MKAYIVCNNCCEQFSSLEPEGKIAELEHLANKSSHTKIFRTNCLGTCVKNKISVIVLNDNTTNNLEHIESLKLLKIKKLLQ